MTAVEQLIYDLRNIDMSIFNDEHCKKYLETEKQQIIDAQMDMFHHINDMPYDLEYLNKRDSAEQFCETYGSKGSDEHIVDTNEMISDEEKTNSQRFDEFMDLVKSSKTEISDEEIEKAVNNPMHDAYDFREGAMWYREQLKSRQ